MNRISQCTFLIVIIIAIYSSAALAQAFAPAAQSVVVRGLKNDVSIRRDHRGIPYIEAKNDADLYFAQGYEMARDRLWQMDLFRRVGRGELAEILGAAVLEQDKRWRKYGFASIVDQNYKHLSLQVRVSLDAYTSGVNAYIATLDAKSLPREFQILQYKPAPWRATDSLLVGKLMADALSSTWRYDLARATFRDLAPEKYQKLFIEKTIYDVLVVGKDLAKDYEAKQPTATDVFPSEQILAAAAKVDAARKESLERIGLYSEYSAISNNWVISGKRTLDRKPILANDPHLAPSAPSIWYLVHLSTPTMRVSGVTFPGSPGVVLGHNNEIAWGATNLGPDVQDLYLETFDDKNRYKTPQGWVNAKSRREEIRVRAGDGSANTKTEPLEVLETRNGVVILDEGGKKYSLKWTARDPKNIEIEAFYYVNRARNWNEFKAALKNYGGSTQNFIYADTKGNIGFHAAGKIPIRKSGDGSLPFDGAKDDGEWIGYIPFAEMPNSFNPPEGFIVTANQRLAGESYKHALGHSWAPPYRAHRIYGLIEANTKHTINDSRDIQHDIFDISNSNFARAILDLNAASDDTLSVLRGWDGRIAADSRAALLVTEIRAAFARRILDANLGAERLKYYFWPNQTSFFDWLIKTQSKDWLPKEFSSYAELLRACDAQARESLSKRIGVDQKKWTFGEVTKARFIHPLAAVPLVGTKFLVPPIAQSGNGSTPNVGAHVSMRHISSAGNWDETRQGIALGISGDPASPHFSDQLDEWKTGNTEKFPFSKKAVEAATVSLITLKPR